MKALFSKLLGNRGEAAAVKYLRSRRIRVITTNYRTSRGEIDIVARDQDTLVFVEVKTRKQGRPAEFVDEQKQRRLTHAAYQFLHQHKLTNQRCRFDVVSIVWPDDTTAPKIEHIQNAFDEPGLGSVPR